MKKIAFLSSGCQSGFIKPREIIAADPECREVASPERADILMVNFCAQSTETLAAFEDLRRKVVQHKSANPKLKIVAGGCIEGLAEKKDLSFAEVTYRHQEEAKVLVELLGKRDRLDLSPNVKNGVAMICIAQGCRRRCSFCKVHYLDDRHLVSRPMSEILELARKALKRGTRIVALFAENATEYGLDIGTNLQTLLEQLLALDGLRILDVNGLCLDEVTPELLQVLQHPKIRTLQLEVQSLNDQIRQNMGLRKTTSDALAILDALSDKFLISNFMTGFPGHSMAEFNREMRQIRTHHLYFLSLDPYDDTPGTPSHEIYKPIDDVESASYQHIFLRTVAKERQLLLERIMRLPHIEAAVVAIDDIEGHSRVCLQASKHTVMIYAEDERSCCSLGAIVKVKIVGLHEDGMHKMLRLRLSDGNDATGRQLVQVMQYFGVDKDQSMTVDGKIIGFVS